jgi:hypothetical protein
MLAVYFFDAEFNVLEYIMKIVHLCGLMKTVFC